jgi:hypothetical protein
MRRKKKVSACRVYRRIFHKYNLFFYGISKEINDAQKNRKKKINVEKIIEKNEEIER